MANLPFIAAVDEGIHQEMARDSSVLYFGQNLATTENHEFVKRYGHDRVRVTPISETAEIGIGVGAAMAGLRPVIELYMAEFLLVALDQVVNEASKSLAMLDENPVLSLLLARHTRESGEVPDGDQLVAVWNAPVRRAGKDVTVVA